MGTSWASLTSSGCSSRHGAHHEAKTLTSTTWPWPKSLSDNPSVRGGRGGSSNSGTGWSISAEGSSSGERPSPKVSATASPTKASRGSRCQTRKRPAREGTLGEPGGMSPCVGFMALSYGLLRRSRARRAGRSERDDERQDEREVAALGAHGEASSAPRCHSPDFFKASATSGGM